MSNPRKFSERIRFHEQKLAEETAAFEKIMLEVSSATKDKTVTNGLEEVAPNPNPQARGRSFRERGSSVGSVGPMRSDKRSGDRSPYSSGPYLSPPPPDTSWKRCNSDSALHQSTLHSSSAESSAHLRSPGSQRRAKVDNQQHDENRYLPESPDKRPKPCYDSPRVPGIHVFPSQQDPGVVPIAFGKNTGSLPDLTNLLTQLSQPINFPFDQDDTHLSSYHSNNHLNVPSYNRFQHPCKDFKVENSLGSGNSREDCHSSLEMQILDQSSIMNCGAGQMNNINMNPTVMYNNIPTSQHQTQQSCTVDGLSEINSSHLNMGNSQLNNNTNSLGSYRSQHSNRPSPQSSPGLGIQYESPLYCNSPQSPSSPSNSSASLNLQKHFEGFSMHDSPIGMDFPSNNTYLTQTDDDVNSKVASDLEYSDTSPLPSLQYTNQSCTTPINILNTKSVQDVPDIILTDYSYGNHQMNNRNDFVKDSNSTNMTFDNVNNFFDPMTLDQLEPLDYLGMIPEPNNDALINSDNF